MAALPGAGGGAGGARAAREAALRRLAAAHDAFQELTANLTEGVKFYNDLTQVHYTMPHSATRPDGVRVGTDSR